MRDFNNTNLMTIRSHFFQDFMRSFSTKVTKTYDISIALF